MSKVDKTHVNSPGGICPHSLTSSLLSPVSYDCVCLVVACVLKPLMSLSCLCLTWDVCVSSPAITCQHLPCFYSCPFFFFHFVKMLSAFHFFVFDLFFFSSQTQKHVSRPLHQPKSSYQDHTTIIDFHPQKIDFLRCTTLLSIHQPP